MDRPTPQHHHERLALTCAALRGLFAGVAHALLDWALNNFTS